MKMENKKEKLRGMVEENPMRVWFSVGMAEEAMMQIKDDLWDSLHSRVLGSSVTEDVLNGISEMVEMNGLPEGCDLDPAFVAACADGDDNLLPLIYITCFMLHGQWGKHLNSVYDEEYERRNTPPTPIPNNEPIPEEMDAQQCLGN